MGSSSWGRRVRHNRVNNDNNKIYSLGLGFVLIPFLLSAHFLPTLQAIAETLLSVGTAPDLPDLGVLLCLSLPVSTPSQYDRSVASITLSSRRAGLPCDLCQ